MTALQRTVANLSP
nr:TPA_asm: m48.5 sORF [Murid betaherpesvirus 1]DBA07789.1 TPA_asm: m48.5 sORF [Murid betaherpesvirus 1]